MKREPKPGDVWARLITGCTILAVGILVWLDHQGQIDASDYFRWWPLILIAFGASHLFERRYLGGAIMGVLGLLFMPHIPFFPHLRVSYVLGLWPLLISVAGVTLIMQSLRPVVRDASAFRAMAVMGGTGRTIDGGGAAAGDAIAVMGGCDITIGPSMREVAIDVLAFWGGVEIKVPPGWRVENRVMPILGAVVDRTAATPDSSAPRLTLRGSVIMGAIEIKEKA